jgi:UDP-GlcNAc:undecaprenyl-phosphate GlcNAc-1-phosphate transferase
MTVFMLFEWTLAVVATAILCIALGPLASRFGLVDHPGHRKVHEIPTPLTGGPAIYLVFGALLFWHSHGNSFEQALFVGGTLVFLVGVADDREHLSHWVRFLVQVAACLVMIYAGDVRLDDFGRLFDGTLIEMSWQSVPLTIFAVLGVINAFNMIDGMDGLSGGIYMVAAGGMAIYAGVAGMADMHWLLLTSMAVVLGFMLLNMRTPWNEKARVFLGDSGSTLLGFVLAWCLVAMGNDNNEIGQRAFNPMMAVWLVAIPLLDTTTLIWRRWRSGVSAFAADQQHLHHAFLRAGFSTTATWLNIMFMALVFAGAGALLELSGLPEFASFYAFLALAFAYFFYMRRTWRIQRFLGRDFIYNDFDEEEEL